ncbi:MAG: hypothetical protein AAFR39_13220 [Pseudomonadota bacterium]
MKKTLITTTILAAIAFAPMPAQAMDNFGMSPEETSAALAQVDKAMAGNLDNVIEQLETLDGPIIVIPYICPHLIEALGRIGVGEIETGSIGKAVVTAIIDDQKMAAEMLFSTGKVPTMAENGMSMQIKMQDRKAVANAISAAKFAQEFLTR